MWLIARLAAGMACALMAAGGPAEARRVALVIGNSAYAHAEPLPNPGNDADAVAAALRRMRFDNITLHRDLSADGMRRALGAFAAEATGAEIAIVFYAGHGIEVDGQNYLIPSDARLARASVVELEAIPLSAVTASIAGAQKLRLVILDACRNNPFRSKMAAAETGTRRRSIGRGLARIEPGDNELIAFAAAGGTEAEDGVGRNSPFTNALLKSLETPGLEVRVLFGAVRDDVLTATGRGQTPHVYGTLGREAIYLVPPAAADVTAAHKSAEAEIARRVAAEKARLEAEMAARLEAERKRLAAGSPTAAAPVAPKPEPPPAKSPVTRAGTMIHAFAGHSDMVLSLALSPDGSTIYSAGHDGKLHAWAAGFNRSSPEWSTDAHDGPVNGVAVVGNGSALVTAGGDRLLKLWTARSGKLMRSVTGHESMVTAVAAPVNGSVIISGGYDGTIRLWDDRLHGQLATIAAHSEPLTSLVMLPDSKGFISASRDKSIKLWSLTVKPDGTAAAEQVWALEGAHDDGVASVAVSPDGEIIASGSWDHSIRLWQRESGTMLREVKGHEGDVYALAFTPDGRTLLSASYDGTIRTWRVDDGTQISSYKAHERFATAVRVWPDGTLFASGGCDVGGEGSACSKGLVKYWALTDIEPKRKSK